jgi:hypothetical protein
LGSVSTFHISFESNHLDIKRPAVPSEASDQRLYRRRVVCTSLLLHEGKGFVLGSGGSTTEESAIARDLLGYLINNPDAQDTLEGIVEWWLFQMKLETRTIKVKEAVADLVAKGLILECTGSDSRVRYRINDRKQSEIRALLDQRAD